MRKIDIGQEVWIENKIVEYLISLSLGSQRVRRSGNEKRFICDMGYD